MRVTICRVAPEMTRIAIGAAAQVLSATAFKMYIFLALDSDGFQRTIKYSDYAQWCNMARSSYYDALQELRAKGFITETNEFLVGAGVALLEEPKPQEEVKKDIYLF